MSRAANSDPVQTPKPTIGRIILHRGTDGVVRPGIVTAVHSESCINAVIFGNDHSDSEAGLKVSLVLSDAEDAAHAWHWMPYQKAQSAAGTSVHA